MNLENYLRHMNWCERKISPGNHYRLNIFPTRVPEVVNYCEYIYFTLHPQKKSHKYFSRLLRYNEGTRSIHEYSYISCSAQRPLLGGGRAWNIFREFIFFGFQNLSVFKHLPIYLLYLKKLWKIWGVAWMLHLECAAQRAF